MGPSVHRKIRMIEEKTIPPIYMFKADWIINNKAYSGEIKYIEDKNFGKLEIGNFEKVLNLFQSPKKEYHNLKYMVSTAVSDHIKDNSKI